VEEAEVEGEPTEEQEEEAVLTDRPLVQLGREL
jgi:hypothetical protein